MEQVFVPNLLQYIRRVNFLIDRKKRFCNNWHRLSSVQMFVCMEVGTYTGLMFSRISTKLGILAHALQYHNNMVHTRGFPSISSSTYLHPAYVISMRTGIVSVLNRYQMKGWYACCRWYRRSTSCWGAPPCRPSGAPPPRSTSTGSSG